MSNYSVMNILDMIDTIGEESAKAILSDFLCHKNNEIESFVREKAIEFAKRKLSITYLVFDDEGEIAGIFALTHKALQIRNTGLSSALRRKIQRFAYVDTETGEFTLSAFLIAQFGKNYRNPGKQDINGTLLMNLTIDMLERIQHEIGGGVIYLECEDKPQLLNFYQNEDNKFRIFDERISEKDGIKYVQLLRVF